MIRFILWFAAAATIALLAYANLRFVNPSVQLEPVDLQTFEVAGLSVVDESFVRSSLMADPAIRAVSFNRSNGLLGITYEYENLEKATLTSVILEKTGLNVTPHVFDDTGKPSCPVHGLVAVWERILHFLRFVD